MTPDGLAGCEHAALLEQVSWIRRLARELVADRELAEDLVQETCAVALERAPREAGKLRQWLAEVLRNALRQHARASGRRRVREALGARPEALEPTDRLVERVLLQRELVNAVLALDEPYRSTVLLRFFEELPPREIARRTGAPVATVNSRLARALARLRERLDGEQRAWAAILLPWVRGVETLGPPTVLSAIMKTKLTLSAAALLLAAGALAWWQAAPGVRPRSAAAETPAAALTEPAFVRAQGALPPEPMGEREAAPVGARSTPAAAAPAPLDPPLPAWTVRLRVLDADGLPMAGVAVCAEESPAILGTSGAGGWCVFQTQAERLVLRAADPRWVTIHEGSPARASSLDPVLVLAPAVTLAGFVRDQPGRPLAHASVRFELPDGFRNRFELLEATRTTGWRALSSADGRFAFERVPAVPGAALVAVLAGYERGRIEAPLVSAEDLELVLSRPSLPLSGVLRGRVLDPLGGPVAGARVGLGLCAVVSDERGEFALPLARAVTAEVLTAVKAGFLPARLERPEEPSARSSGWPDEVTLVLGGPALAIHGVVLDHEEHPVAGARVWIHDPTPCTPIGQIPAFLEPLMAGAPVPAGALESEARLPEQDGDHFYDWHTNAREPSALWNWVVTDAAGRFELGGLDQRRYRLDVLRPDSLELVTTEAFAAGEHSAVVRLGAPELFERVEGRVLSEHGKPQPDVEVTLFRPMVDARARIFGGNSQVVMIEVAGRATTDAEGRFHFERVPRRGAEVSVRGDAIVPCSVPIEGASVEVEVEVRCHFEVVLRESAGRFDAIQVTDGDGQGLDLLVLTEGSVNAWSGVSLVEGRSGVVSVSSRARTLELRKSGVVVETRPLVLVPGEVTRIEL